MTDKYLDFHAHTHYSDGVSSPETVVKTARLNGLDMVAITDHDKVSGITEAVEAGRNWDIEVIPGIEISTSRYHILGINIDYADRGFMDFVKESAREQEEVCRARIEVMRSRGIPISMKKLKKYFPKARLGKFNLCMAMIQDRDCREHFNKRGIRLINENYQDYLKDADGKDIVDKATSISPERAIKEIHKAGGIAIIAHPFKDVKDMSEMDVLVKQGLDGLEIQPAHNRKNEAFEEYARKNNLLMTYGSDFHGGLFNRPLLKRENNILSPELMKALGRS